MRNVGMLGTIRTRFRRLGAGLALVAMTSSQACYAYKPIASAVSPKIGERARIVLTPDGTTELARYLGPNVSIVEGTVSSIRDDGTLVVAVTFVQQLNGIRQGWTGEGMVSIPPQYRSEVHERAFLRNQSIVATVVFVSAIIATTVVALRAGGAKGGTDAGGTPPPP